MIHRDVAGDPVSHSTRGTAVRRAVRAARRAQIDETRQLSVQLRDALRDAELLQAEASDVAYRKSSNV